MKRLREYILRWMLGEERYKKLNASDEVKINVRRVEPNEVAEVMKIFDEVAQSMEKAGKMTKADLYIRTGKGRFSFLQKVGEAPVPESSTWIKVPMVMQDFFGANMGAHRHHHLLVFKKVVMQKESAEIMGNMFVCDMPDGQRQGLSL